MQLYFLGIYTAFKLAHFSPFFFRIVASIPPNNMTIIEQVTRLNDKGVAKFADVDVERT